MGVCSEGSNGIGRYGCDGGVSGRGKCILQYTFLKKN